MSVSVLKKVARVPDEYQEVEYIQTTGTQYIDLTYSYVINDEIECDFIMDNTTGAIQGVFGNGNAGFIGTSLYIDTSTKLSVTVGGILGQQFYKWATPLTTGQKYRVKIAGDALYVNGSVVLTVANTLSNGTQSDFSIFRRWGTNSLVGKIYKMSIKRGGIYIFDFIPCYRKSDNVIGMYDLVNSVFYTNSGTGTFLKGGDIAPYIAERQSINVLEMTLPKEYQQVEYIQSSGTQYIDTGYTFTSNNYDVEAVGLTTVQGREMSLFAVIPDAQLSGIEVGWSATLNRLFAFNTSSSLAYNNYDAYNKKIKFHIWRDSNERCFQVDNSTVQHDSNVLNTNGYKVFTHRYGSGNWFSGNLYSLKIKDNGVLVRDLIPCYRKSDGEIGMFDLVSGTFFTNSGTGTFAKGDNVALPIKRVRACILEPVLPSAYQQVEYIESSGTQWIDTGYKPNGNTKIEIKYQTPTQSTTQQGIFGARDTNGTNRFLIFTGSQPNALQADYYAGSSLAIYTENISGFNGRAKNIIEMSNYLKINGNSISSVNKVEFQTNSNMYLFAVNNNGAALLPMVGSIWYCKLWDNNTLVRNFIPCYRKSDSVVGLYDLVTKTFYTNSGTGTFSKGADATKYNIIRL